MKLNTDNPDTMPITDAVYGRKKHTNLARKAYEPRDNRTPVWRTVPVTVLNQLARQGRDTRRLAARRRQEGS